jgi:hypothetical protein
MGTPIKETRVRKLIPLVTALLGAMTLLIALVRTILAGYGAEWTGFGAYILSDSSYVRGKTLWDWMDLLFIPLFLALGVFILQRSERALERRAAEQRAKLEREIAKDRQQEAGLQAYLDRMTELLLDEKLQQNNREKALNMMRVRTLTALREGTTHTESELTGICIHTLL